MDFGLFVIVVKYFYLELGFIMKKIVILAFIFLSFPSLSSVNIIESANGSYVVTFSDSISLTSNQSVDDAKRILLSKAKSDSSQLIGGHVYTSLVLDGDVISRDEVVVITSHHIEVIDSIFSTTLDSASNIVVSLESSLFIAENVFDDEVAKWSELESLKAINAELISENDKLIDLIMNDPSGSQNKVAGKKIGLDVNFNSTESNFDSLSYSKVKIANSVFRHFAESVVINFGELKTIKREDGDYDVYVQYGWGSEHVEYKRLLGETLNVLPDVLNHNSGSVIVKESANDSDVLDKMLYDYLSNTKVMLVFVPMLSSYEPIKVSVTGTRYIDFEGESFQFQASKPKGMNAELSDVGKYLIFEKVKFEELGKLRVLNYEVVIE